MINGNESTKRPTEKSLRQFLTKKSIEFYSKFEDEDELTSYVFQQMEEDDNDYDRDEIDATVQVHTTRYNIVKLIQNPPAENFMEFRETIAENNGDILNYLSLQSNESIQAQERDDRVNKRQRTESPGSPETAPQRYKVSQAELDKITRNVPTKYLKDWFILKIDQFIEEEDEVKLNSDEDKDPAKKVVPMQQELFDSRFIAYCICAITKFIEIAEEEVLNARHDIAIAMKAAKLAKRELNDIVKGLVGNNPKKVKEARRFIFMNFEKIVDMNKLAKADLFQTLATVV